MRREARQVALSVERDEVAEVGIGRIERIGGVERISPAGREVAVREAHLVRESGPERKFVQPLVETYALDVVEASSGQLLSQVLQEKGVFTSAELSAAQAMVTSSRIW